MANLVERCLSQMTWVNVMHLGKLQHPLLKLELNFQNYYHLIKFALSNCTWDPLSMLRLQMWRLSTHFLHMLFGRPHPDQKTETTQTNQKPQRECPHDGNNGPLFRLFGKLKIKTSDRWTLKTNVEKTRKHLTRKHCSQTTTTNAHNQWQRHGHTAFRCAWCFIRFCVNC